jgi:hypothetical protein
MFKTSEWFNTCGTYHTKHQLATEQSENAEIKTKLPEHKAKMM